MKTDHGKTIDPAELWLRPPATPSEAIRHADGLADACVAAHGPGIEPHVRYPTWSAEAAFGISRRADEIGLGDDEQRSWTWLAACLGSVTAAGEMGAILVGHGVSLRGAEAKACQRRGAEWFSLRDARAPAVPPGVPSPIESALLIEAGMEGDDFHDVPEEDPVHGRVVIAAIGDARSREGQDISRRYADIVGKTLPYRGDMPGPGVIHAEILARWPWARIAADRIESALAVRRLSADGFVRLPNLLLIGPAGSGKTSLAEWLPVRLGLHRLTIPCGGASDAAGLTATTRSWSTSRPGAVVNAMQDGATCNPVLVLDEVDKTTASNSQNGSVEAALLQLVNARSFQDQCLFASVDVSAVSYVATANALTGVNPFLRDRFDVIPVPAPREGDLPVLHANALADFAAHNGIPAAGLPAVPEAARLFLRETFRKSGRSARSYALALGRVLSYEIGLRETSRIRRDEAEAASRARILDAFATGTLPDGPMH